MFSALALLACSLVTGLCAAVLMLRSRLKREWRKREAMQQQIAALRAAAGAGERAEAASEAKSRFLANVSHEVRTPLAGILGMADLLACTGLSGEQAAYAEAIRTCGNALGGLIDEILDFSRIEAGRLELADSEVDVVALVEGVVELLAPRAHAKGLEIASLIDAEVPSSMRGDGARLRQILLNLVGNAVKFTATGGVGLRVSILEDALAFRVEDTGPGIPEGRREAIFEEFEQAPDSPAGNLGGTGLGLAIARRLAVAMGGQLDLAPATEAGSTFRLHVPLRAMVPGPSVAKNVTAFRPGSRALIVTRSIFEGPFLAACLEVAGFCVQREADPPLALACLQDQPAPDLIVIDCAFGPQTVEMLVSAACAAGVARRLILLSPQERRSFGELMMAEGTGWLVKPVRQQSLFARLRRDGETKSPPALPLSQFVGHPRHRVLLAEDNAINALVATKQLERLGADVERVCDGPTALAALRRALLGETAAFDLVLMDLRMPGCDGREVTREIRHLEAVLGRSRLRMIALTANGLESDRQSSLAAGFDDFLVKPVDFERLSEVILVPRGSAIIVPPVAVISAMPFSKAS